MTHEEAIAFLVLMKWQLPPSDLRTPVRRWDTIS